MYMAIWNEAKILLMSGGLWSGLNAKRGETCRHSSIPPQWWQKLYARLKLAAKSSREALFCRLLVAESRKPTRLSFLDRYPGRIRKRARMKLRFALLVKAELQSGGSELSSEALRLARLL